MFGMSFVEIGVIALLALVFLGPEKLPGLAKTAGKVLREVRKATTDLRRAVEMDDVRRDIQQQLRDSAKRRELETPNDPYAGLAQEERDWQSQNSLAEHDEDPDEYPLDDEGQDSDDDLDVYQTHQQQGFSGDFAPPPGALTSNTPPLPGATDALPKTIVAASLPMAHSVDPKTTSRAKIKAARLDVLGGVTAIEVIGGVGPLLPEDNGQHTQWSTTNVPRCIPSNGGDVKIARQRIPAAPLGLLGGVMAIPVEGGPQNHDELQGGALS